jgi:hypothetical protein
MERSHHLLSGNLPNDMLDVMFCEVLRGVVDRDYSLILHQDVYISAVWNTRIAK